MKKQGRGDSTDSNNSDYLSAKSSEVLSFDDISEDEVKNHSARSPIRPIEKIIYLYDKYKENISRIDDLVSFASYQVSTTEHAISIINENKGLSNIVLIANTSIAKGIEEDLPSNIEKFIVIPDVNNQGNLTYCSKEWQEWQKLVDAQVGHYEKTKISCVPIEALYLYLHLLLGESLGSYNQNNKLHCTDNIDTKKDLPCDDKVDLLSNLDGYIEDSYLQ